MNLYIHSLIRPHGVVVCWLSTGTTVPFTFYWIWNSGTTHFRTTFACQWITMDHLAVAESRLTTFEAHRSNFCVKVLDLRSSYGIILRHKGNKNLSLVMCGMPGGWWVTLSFWATVMNNLPAILNTHLRCGHSRMSHSQQGAHLLDCSWLHCPPSVRRQSN
jgi:hypothetical protein